MQGGRAERLGLLVTKNGGLMQLNAVRCQLGEVIVIDYQASLKLLGESL